MPDYLYQGFEISEQRVKNAAQKLGLSVDEYIKKYKFTPIKKETDVLVETKQQEDR